MDILLLLSLSIRNIFLFSIMSLENPVLKQLYSLSPETITKLSLYFFNSLIEFLT